MRQLPRAAVTVAEVSLAALLAAACTAQPDPAVVATPPADGITPEPGLTSPRPTTDPDAAANDAVFGRWRRTPAHPTGQVVDAAETACRGQDAVGDLPLLVVDARGEGEATLVFADPKAAAVCHATLAAGGATTADARPVAGYPDTAPASRKLGAHDLEIVESKGGARTVLVGRVGPDVSRVAAQFEDATWSNASLADGWYAMWWPGREPALTVAAVDTRSEAVDGFSP
jgi:hypothetical protein